MLESEGEVDVRISTDGKIAEIAPARSLRAAGGEGVIDCKDKLLLPGFVNAHTHSTEMLSRGLIPPLPLDLWVLRLLSLTGVATARFNDPADAYYLSALHSGVECLMSGCTAVLDHCFVRSVEQAAASCRAYRELGVRVFFAPMLDDDAVMYHNYVPVAGDAGERNARGERDGLGEGGAYRTASAPSDAAKCRAAVALWENCVAELHRPEEGVNIVIGPVTAYSCSPRMLRAAADLRRRHGLHGHIHLLESRAQKMEATRLFKEQGGSAARYLDECGFLKVEGTVTSCAHCCWLTDEDMRVMAECGACVVHNPLSNLRLGSGVCGVRRCLDRGVRVGVGIDGSCSSDGQDMTEAIKLTSLVSTLHSPDYRTWVSGREALRLACEGGHYAVGMGETAGKVEAGRQADLTLWDLTALSMLPRGDAASLLALGRPQQGPAEAGSALQTVFVRGRRVLSQGLPLGCDLGALRRAIWSATAVRKPGAEAHDEQATPGPDVHRRAEAEYRAALGLDPGGKRPAETAANLTWDAAGKM